MPLNRIPVRICRYTIIDPGKALFLRLSTNFEEAYLRDYLELAKIVSSYFVWELMLTAEHGAGSQVHPISAVASSDWPRFTVHTQAPAGGSKTIKIYDFVVLE